VFSSVDGVTIAGMGARPIGSHGHYPAKFFSVPKGVAVAAREGLELRKQFGRGGTDVGIARARQLASGSPRVTLRDIVYIRSYLRRHIVDNLDQRDPPSNGWIAWLLWGGWPAKRWAEGVYARAQRKGWLARRNPVPSTNHDAAFWRDVDVAIRAFRDDPRAKDLLRENRFTAWDDGGCLALQQALMLFFADVLESDDALDASVDVQPGYVMSPGLTEHALVWVERVGDAPLVVDSAGVRPGDTSARDWQKRRNAEGREMMTVLYDELPSAWFERWRARIADEKLVVQVRHIFEEHYVKTQQAKAQPRRNPFDSKGLPMGGGRHPYIMVRCVNGVINGRLEQSGRRVATASDVSISHAICTAMLQKQGVFREGTRELTAKGRRKNEWMFSEERGAVAQQRLREYEQHLGTAKTHKEPRRNPVVGDITELMRIAAPLVAGDDPDRLEEAAHIVAGAAISQMPPARFWDSLVDARYNLVKMLSVVDANLNRDLSLKPLPLLLVAIQHRALDEKAARTWAVLNTEWPTRLMDPNYMMTYLARIDPLMACWTWLVTVKENYTGSDPRFRQMIDRLIQWSKGEMVVRGPSGSNLTPKQAFARLQPPENPNADSLDLWAWSIVSDCLSSNAFPGHSLEVIDWSIYSQSKVPKTQWARMFAENIHDLPPFLLSEPFRHVRSNRPDINWDL
jgi:hypothetical protein